MLIMVFVPFVDNLLIEKIQITFVNKKSGRKRERERGRNPASRDFRFRTELCNFAPKFEMCE